MAGMTDTAFRRLVKRQGGCGLVVTEMVSSEGLVRGIDRTLEYAEFTEEERPVAVQIFGGDPGKMARAAQVVEALGADAVDVNMGCPVPKISKHNAGCSLMREPGHAREIVASMVKAVKIPVTVKMRAGWNEAEVNAPDLARRMEDAGAAAISVHGRTAAQSYSGRADWDLIACVARSVSIPVFGNGDCVEPEDLLERLRSTGVAGILVGRGVLRNPWIFAQAAAVMDGRPVPQVSLADRGRFLLDYMDLLLRGDSADPAGFRHSIGPARGHEAEGAGHEAEGGGREAEGGGREAESAGHEAEGGEREAEGGGREAESGARDAAIQALSVPARGRDRWVINKIRALSAWYTRGFEDGSHLRQAINHTDSLAALRTTIHAFFGSQ
jgi:nifR3 family TIM-barrel protein